jgi:bifunctional non-homologous end joining protein LigD
LRISTKSEQRERVFCRPFSTGRVGTGSFADQAQSLHADIEKVVSDKPTFAKALSAGAEKAVRWAEPRLVCEVEYRGWTLDGLLRAPSFKGLKEDKPAEQIVLEETAKRSDPS